MSNDTVQVPRETLRQWCDITTDWNAHTRKWVQDEMQQLLAGSPSPADETDRTTQEAKDTARLNWLEQLASEGACPAVLNDDNGHWAVAFDGMQNVPEDDGPQDIQTTFFVEAKDWHASIREALDDAMENPK